MNYPDEYDFFQTITEIKGNFRYCAPELRGNSSSSLRSHLEVKPHP